MKKNKFVKLIEHILVALPLLYVGGVALYTMINENSKDSYYGETINQTELIEGYDNLEKYYYLPIGSFNTSETIIYDVSNVTIQGNAPSGILDNSAYINTFFFYTSGENYICRVDFDNGLNSVFWFYNNSAYANAILGFYFRDLPINQNFGSYIYYYTYNNLSFLDNALPYAMSEFNKLGFNKIPFTQFFVNIFHNGETNVYIDFVNNYLNYMLFVECCYFVPMILYWFIHLGEYVVDNFTRKGDRL